MQEDWSCLLPVAVDWPLENPSQTGLSWPLTRLISASWTQSVHLHFVPLHTAVSEGIYSPHLQCLAERPNSSPQILTTKSITPPHHRSLLGSCEGLSGPQDLGPWLNSPKSIACESPKAVPDSSQIPGRLVFLWYPPPPVYSRLLLSIVSTPTDTTASLPISTKKLPSRKTFISRLF